jgi:hypothetical protein
MKDALPRPLLHRSILWVPAVGARLKRSRQWCAVAGESSEWRTARGEDAYFPSRKFWYTFDAVQIRVIRG